MVKQRMDLLELLRKRGMDGDVDFLREALRVLVDGIMDAEVSAVLLVNAATVARARKRYVEEGLEAAINDRPWPGRERKLDGRQEAHLIAFACSAAPEGHTHWTLQLLADKVVELEFAESISLETVRQLLKKTNSVVSPGRRKSGVSPR